MKRASRTYDFKRVAPEIHAAWDRIGLNTTPIEQAKKPYYNLMMFPYPSAEGLHVGNMYAFTGSDIFGRFMRMQGYDVFEPIGLDGFGIHSENYALKVDRHPMDHAARTEKNFYQQLSTIGAMFDWSRTVETYHPDYYRWTQWLFVQMFKAGLAYRAKAEVNWCPHCKTVLADEQVINGACERCGNTVIKKLLEQWFFRITAYAEKLLENLRSLKWSKKVLIAQENWIGKKEGINITYRVVSGKNEPIGEVVCFTTRPDTNFGATFVVLSPDHPFISQILRVIDPKKAARITKYVEKTKRMTQQDRLAQANEKTGVQTGLFCINELNGYRMPLFISDFVLMEVGTGAVVGVPGHDVRDFEFAQAFDIPVKRVVVAPDGKRGPITTVDDVQEDTGTMVDSDFLDGMEIGEAIDAMKQHLEDNGWGVRVTSYHLRDWLISRQRYWGPPIPMMFCEQCAKEGRSWFTTEEAKNAKGGFGEWESVGWYPVPEDQLPVVLPRIDDYRPGDDGIAPLAKHREFYETVCPVCDRKAVRETDVSDTFLDSSWYFLRYPSVRAKTATTDAFDPKITKKWLPVDMYTGGAEHSVLHLMYARFITMVLHDMGYLDFEEPFTNFFAHGLVIKDGAKMSKSKGNVVNPDEYIDTYGADALRMYLMFMGPFAQGGDFRDSAMEGTSRWIHRVWRIASASMQETDLDTSPLDRPLALLIKKVGDDTQNRRYNTAIAAMMEFTNTVADQGGIMSREQLSSFVLLLAPYAPYLAETVWQRLAGREEPTSVSESVHAQMWPGYDERNLAAEHVSVIVQINGKVRDTLRVDSSQSTDETFIVSEAKKLQKVQKFLGSDPIVKTIFVPGRLVNFVL